jgi:hypothetical protein
MKIEDRWTRLVNRGQETDEEDKQFRATTQAYVVYNDWHLTTKAPVHVIYHDVPKRSAVAAVAHCGGQ